MNDLRRLKAEANIADVVDSLGIQVFSQGVNKFIYCPIPEHNDTRPTNCHFRNGWNSARCERCGKSINAIDMIVYTTGASFGEAADRLWEISGRPDWYYDKSWQNKDQKQRFTISVSEANLIGLYLPRLMQRPLKWTQYKEVLKPENMPKGTSYAAGIDGWLSVKSETVSWTDFADEDTIKALVKAKCDERERRYDAIEKIFRELNILADDERILEKEREIIAQLKKRCSS